MLLAKKAISPGETKRYTVDYSDWLDDGETIASKVITVAFEDGYSGDASIGSSSFTSTQVIFFVLGGTTAVGQIFDVEISATTSVGQVKLDHIQFTTFEP